MYSNTDDNKLPEELNSSLANHKNRGVCRIPRDPMSFIFGEMKSVGKNRIVDSYKLLTRDNSEKVIFTNKLNYILLEHSIKSKEVLNF